MAIECPRCKAASPDGKKFCGECGSPLDASAPASGVQPAAALRDQVSAILEQRYRDQKVVEIETTQAIANRLLEWAKLLAFFVGIPVTLLLLILGVLGIKTYRDLLTEIDKAHASVTAAADAALARLKTQSDAVDHDYQELRAKISNTAALQAQFETLSKKVDDIGEKVGFTPTSKISNETRRRLEDGFAKFGGYVKGLGYRSAPGSTFGTIGVEDKISGGAPAFYDTRKRELIIGREYVDDLTILYRAYMIHVLDSSGPGMKLNDYSAIASGLATYFSYSFVDNPSPDTPTAWDLTKQRPLTDIKPTDLSMLNDGTEIWGSTFWELRTMLGKDAADKLLLEAWFGLHAADVRADRGASFVRKLIDLEKTHEAEIRAVYARRGLSL
jgi:hypothetical protein